MLKFYIYQKFDNSKYVDFIENFIKNLEFAAR